MAKNKIILFTLFYLGIFLWLFFVGQAGGVSGMSGDINFIDEGQFAAWLSHMFEGKVLYTDFFVQYGPLLIYPSYELMKIFGESFFFVRFVLVTVGVFLGIVVALSAMRHLKIHPIIMGVIFLFLLIVPGMHIRHFTAILFFIAVVSGYKSKSIKSLSISGGVLALIIFISIEVAIFSFIIFVLYIFIRFIKNKNIKDEIRFLVYFLFGNISTALILGLFGIQQGWLANYLQTSMHIIVSLSGVNLPNGQGFSSILHSLGQDASFFEVIQRLLSKQMLFYWSLLLLIIFIAVEAFRFMSGRANEKDTLASMIAFFALFTYASIIGRSGHYLIVFPYLLILYGYLLSFLYPIDLTNKKSHKIVSTIFLLLFLLYGFRHLAIFRYSIFSNLDLSNNKTSISSVFPLKISKKQANEIKTLQSFINNTTKNTDTIYIFNNAPALYFFIKRANPTPYDLPLLAGTKEKRMKIISALRSHPPKFIIEDLKAWSVDEVSDRQRMPDVINFIEQNYPEKKYVGKYVIYGKSYIQ